jgi:hypothetical protein
MIWPQASRCLPILPASLMKMDLWHGLVFVATTPENQFLSATPELNEEVFFD